MKKKILIISIFFIFILVWIQKPDPVSRPFEFRGGVRHSGGGYIKSTSHVLVNSINYNIEELYQTIYEEFTLMNGEHNEVTFYLYDNLENLHSNNPFSERTFKDP